MGRMQRGTLATCTRAPVPVCSASHALIRVLPCAAWQAVHGTAGLPAVALSVACGAWDRFKQCTTGDFVL